MAQGKQAKILTRHQEQAVLDYVSHTRNAVRDRVVFLLSIKAGLRAKEMAGLTWGMVTDGEGQVAECLALPDQATKGTSGRTIYLHPALRDALCALARTLPVHLRTPERPVIYSMRGRGLSAASVTEWFLRNYKRVTSKEEFSLPLFREMLTELKDAERLSITFRFTLGSSKLETRSQSEAERFARLLAAGAYAGKDILLVGFTDSVGEFNVNRNLAVRRAQSVLDTLKASVAEGALDAVPVLVQSYGELTPVGCNETPQGRELNRRVEVWVRDKRG